MPQEIWIATCNMSKVSSRAAATIYSLSKKGEQYIKALIEIAEEIKNGAGSATIEKLVYEIITGGFNNDDEEEIITDPSGSVLASWKKGGIFFSKNINVDKKKLNKLLLEFLQN